MHSPDILSSCNAHSSPEFDGLTGPSRHGNNDVETNDSNLEELQEQVIANLRNPNVPNVNVPEKIVFCIDVCHDNQTLPYKLADGTSFTPMNMMKRVLDFFVYSKHAINKRTEFALLVMKNTEVVWVQNFTNNLKEIINSIDHLNPEESTEESFDFQKVLNILKHKVEIPDYQQDSCILPPSNVVRMIVIYGRSNCIPIVSLEDEYFTFLKKQLYFYIDIMLAHEEDCALYKCEEAYDALQNLDNGYSYVFEVSRNAAKIHEFIAKLLAHPMQRPLQKKTDYSFGRKYSSQFM